MIAPRGPTAAGRLLRRVGQHDHEESGGGVEFCHASCPSATEPASPEVHMAVVLISPDALERGADVDQLGQSLNPQGLELHPVTRRCRA